MADFAQNQNNYSDTPDDELDEEAQNAIELDAEQELYAAQSSAVELHNQGQEFRHPSFFKYFVLAAPLAFIADGIDIFAEISVIGIPYGRLISFAATTIMLLVFWFTNTKQKRADGYVENIERNLEIITQRIANAEKNIVRAARLSRHIPGAKQMYRKLHVATIRRARVALRKVVRSTKSPILRFAATSILNLVPLLALMPWMLIGVWLSYRAEKESYKNAREASDSVLEAIGETATV